MSVSPAIRSSFGLASQHGRLVASVLAASWWPDPPALDLCPEVLPTVMPLLVKGGCAGLGWRRLRQTTARQSPSACSLKQLYSIEAVQTALRKRQIANLFSLLRSRGIEPVLTKGLAAGRLYPELGLRPCGDIDLLVMPEKLAEARDLLQITDPQHGLLDVKSHHLEPYRRPLSEVYARSELVLMGGAETRVLGPEDALRHLCTHLWMHGGSRPLWLCDVAVALEARPAAFDWDLCLDGDALCANWVATAVQAAHALLGASLKGTPFSGNADRLPGWVSPAIAHMWGAPDDSRSAAPFVCDHLLRPDLLLKALYFRWLNPVLATGRLHRPFRRLPPLRLQVRRALLLSQRRLRRLA